MTISAVVAFPIGYVVMSHWIESYVRRTTMDGWIYISIFVVVAVIIYFVSLDECGKRRDRIRQK